MNNRERAMAVLQYESYDRLPVVHFGYWGETLLKWAEEGHISHDLATSWWDGSAADRELEQIIGWDFNWGACCAGIHCGLIPGFERKVLKEHPDGSREVLDPQGVIVLEKHGTQGIPSEIGHTLVDRASWEEHYIPRLQWDDQRAPAEAFRALPDPATSDRPVGLSAGSMVGVLRNMIGVEGVAYIHADDPELFEEMVTTIADLAVRGAAIAMEHGPRFDFIHFWEDICYKSGPLVSPNVFRDLIAPHYKRIMDIAHAGGTTLGSVDCDGKIDALVPYWLQNGVNVMFPIEVGTWHASIAPWREQYGRELRGVGGMNKVVFAQDRPAIDQEIERLKALVDLGGYIPCPDHRIAPDAKFDLVCYYCERMRATFG